MDLRKLVDLCYFFYKYFKGLDILKEKNLFVERNPIKKIKLF